MSAGALMDYDFGQKRHWRRWVWNRITEKTINPYGGSLLDVGLVAVIARTMSESHTFPEVTPEMIRAGVAVLRASDYGSALRFDTDESIVIAIHRAMQCISLAQECTSQTAEADIHQSDGPTP